MTPHAPQVSARRVLALAVPALGVLAAEPLYLLVDTAVVGRLGAVALAVGGVVLVQVSLQLTFLSYGTTAHTARLYGSGQRAAAVAQGAQASWLALGGRQRDLGPAVPRAGSWCRAGGGHRAARFGRG